jgi:hypothetical protein
MFMNNNSARIKQYSKVSTNLACLSNEKLKQILADAKPMHEGIGGKSALISIDDSPVFVKKVPLTDLEQLDQNFISTANLFDLPLGYQYGVGSAGFGAWRELATHIMTTNWVIAGECANFPIMYHWRILPNDSSELNISNSSPQKRSSLSITRAFLSENLFPQEHGTKRSIAGCTPMLPL